MDAGPVGDPSVRRPVHGRSPRGRRPTWSTVLAVVAALPVVVATGRALVRGWLPMGDNAYFAIRARDVLTAHHPLVGAWSSGSETVGFDVNNLGPLQLDLLALPVRVDWAAGTAVGVALVNVAAVVVGVVVGGRLAGRAGAAAVAAAAAGLSWAMGSELLFEPRQHHALLLPFLCFLVLVWAMAAGRSWALPLAVGVGSLLVQTHLTYVLLVAVLGTVGVVGLGLAARQRATLRQGLRRSAVAAAVVAALCWAQPVVEQLTADDRGNLSAVVAAAGEGEAGAGAAHGARAVAAVVALPPWSSASGFERFDPTDLPAAGAAAAGLLALGGLVVAAAAAARRAGDREVLAAVVVAVTAVVAAWASAATQPIGGPFGLVAGNYRWLWPVAWFTVAVLVVALERGAAGRIPLTPAVAVAAAVLAALALVPAHRVLVTRADEPLVPVARRLVDQLDPLRGREPLTVARGRLFFGEPYTYVLLAGLQDRGVDFDLAADLDVQRFGRGRRATPGAAVVTLVLGDAAADPPSGWERVAFATGLTPGERSELDRLRATGAATARRRALEERWQRETVAVVLRPGR